MRSVKDSPSYNRIFCLVHAERLSYLISDKVLHSLAELTQGQSGMLVDYGLLGIETKAKDLLE